MKPSEIKVGKTYCNRGEGRTNCEEIIWPSPKTIKRANKILSTATIVNNNCIELSIKPTDTGYYHIGAFGKRTTAHRIIYMLLNGIVSRNIDICHTCDNRRCINPDHLFKGSRADNMQDAISKGRNAKGIRSRTGLLDEKDIREILIQIKNKASYKELALKYRVTPETISRTARINGIRKIVFKNDPPISKEKVLEMISKGFKYSLIAKQFKVGPSRISQIALSSGIKKISRRKHE